MTADAGLPWPADGKAKVIDALRGVVDGRIAEEGEGPADKRLLRLAALAALARNGASTTAMLGQAAIPIGDMPTATLADWLVTLDKTPGADPTLKAQAEAALRGRIVYEGTRLDLVDKAVAPWWMMVSDDEMALKAIIAVTGRPGWAQDAPKMMIGVSLRQAHGHWDTTPANAWGTLAVRRFAAAYPGTATGVTTARLGAQTVSRTWPSPASILFAPPAGRASLLLSHSTQPGPWATVSVRAAVPLTAPAFAGYRITRQVSFVERAHPDRLSRGDGTEDTPYRRRTRRPDLGRDRGPDPRRCLDRQRRGRAIGPIGREGERWRWRIAQLYRAWAGRLARLFRLVAQGDDGGGICGAGEWHGPLSCCRRRGWRRCIRPRFTRRCPTPRWSSRRDARHPDVAMAAAPTVTVAAGADAGRARGRASGPDHRRCRPTRRRARRGVPARRGCAIGMAGCWRRCAWTLQCAGSTGCRSTTSRLRCVPT